MGFVVLKKTANGNYLLKQSEAGEGSQPIGIEKMFLYRARRKAAVVFDTIASVHAPFYLAKSIAGEIAPGETLYAKNSDEREGRK